jgi:glycosyltransferase involved in cell wall biosynthesis
VVAKARTGIREFVRHGEEGLLATSDADMVVQLTRIVTDHALRARITEHNRTTTSPVDWSVVVERNVAAYREAIAMAAPVSPPPRSRRGGARGGGRPG